ncbi:MAG: putative collagen-binding domain-containing protein [Planctomycetota bacterium]
MHAADALTANPGDYCLARPGQVYAVYLPDGGTTPLDLGDSTATFDVAWYNPRTGGDLLPGSIRSITGPGPKSIGRPPADPGDDWAVLVKIGSVLLDD